MKARVCITILLGIVSVACESAPEPVIEVSYGRRLVTTVWDTVLAVGVADPNDTTLLSPRRLRLGPRRVYVIDDINQNLRAIDLSSGRLVWSYSDEGRGPDQISNVADVQVLADGTIWLLDVGNGKFLIFGNDGRLLDSHTLQVGERKPARFVILGNEMLLFSNYPETAFSSAKLDSMVVSKGRQLPWPEELTVDRNFGLSTAVSHREHDSTWVAAFDHGPGFMVGRGDQIEAYRYIEPKQFPLKSGPKVRAAGADSAEFAGLATSLVGDSLYVLFGGRPHRRAHPPEETRLIDCYSASNGRYLFSHYLPGDTWSMDTWDGQTFYVLTESDGLPVLLGLRRRDSPSET